MTQAGDSALRWCWKRFTSTCRSQQSRARAAASPRPGTPCPALPGVVTPQPVSWPPPRTTYLRSSQRGVRKPWRTWCPSSSPHAMPPWVTQQDWLSHGGECYWFSQASKPWRGAQEDCVERRARMVMSRGRDELELLNNHTKGLYPIWIGVHVFPSTAEPDRSWTHGSTPDTNRAEDGSGEVCASKAWKGESSWVRKFAPAEPATKIFGGSAELRVNGDRRRWQRFWAAASEAAPGLGRFGRKRRLPE
ncbi:uncharacterized protein LOC142359657 isoform X7 [Opisthocomus hoazin]|uniref:uncharacterized protein LOC142359657 isoform X7 n=1 Tax=Opisthocomus hoazin TaxID=30419 RepID=UPI003F52ED7F